MDGPKWRKSERERQISYGITFIWNLKYDTNKVIYETETDPKTENKHTDTNGEKEWGWHKLEVWD